MLIQGAWLEARSRPLPIYLPGELIAPLKDWLDAVYLPASVIGFPLAYQAWETLPGQQATLAGSEVRVQASPTTHLDGLRALIDPAAHDQFRAYSLAFRLAGDGSSAGVFRRSRASRRTWNRCWFSRAICWFASWRTSHRKPCFPTCVASRSGGFA